ncbi:glycosyltransferase [Luminiphilus sp.]|nr:glycosyltransferase [Luminiphilus sp.]
MKILHSAFVSWDEPGILRQTQWEEEAAKALGLNWKSVLYVPLSSRLSGPSVVKSHVSLSARGLKLGSHLIYWVRLRRAYYRWLHEQSQDYDAILLRHSTHDPFRLGFLKKCRVPVFSVHHTLEVPEIHGTKSWSTEFKAVAEAYWGGRGIERATGVIGVTSEIVEYELNRTNASDKLAFVYPNGVYFNEAEIQNLRDRRSLSTPEILFVASSFSPWHGLDILLKSVSESDDEFVLHLVGKISNADKVAALKDSRIVLHGLCDQDKISDLSERAWVGLSSFALERKSMKQACTLKVREYLLRGVPVYAGYDDVFPEGFCGYRKGPASVSLILNYTREIRHISRLDVVREAEPFISKERLVEGLSNWLDEHLKTDAPVWRS